MPIPITRAELAEHDRTDMLAHMRALFTLPDGVVYLDGNSLGALPRATPGRVAAVVAEEWGQGLIRSWNDAGWMSLPGRVADKIATLVGAPTGSVMVADSTSVNLFKLLAAGLALRPDRRVILSERRNFPTDLYIAQGLAALLGQGHELHLVEADQIEAALDGRVAVLMLTHVNYHSGAMHDMLALTRRAQAAGALVLWDLAHSAGAVPVDLVGCDADLAVGCGYKFLNGGPGAPAFLYVAPRLHDAIRFPITGWLGHAAPFDFETGYRPAAGIAGAMVGTPPVLSLAALEVGVDIALSASMAEIRAKSLRQGALFAALVEQECDGFGFVVTSPADAQRRGSQVCLAHPDAYAIMQALIARGVIGDFRAPDILRFGITPLYLGYADLWDAVQVLREVMASGAWKAPAFSVRRAVDLNTMKTAGDMNMDFARFRASLEQAAPPDGLGGALQGLWWDAKGDWAKAHACAQDDPGRDGDAVHAYLHRVEGDLANAGYWYRRAGREQATGPLEAEWAALAREMLKG